MPKRVGLVVGMEDTFPRPFIERVNAKGGGDVVAEMAILDGCPEVTDPPKYDVIVDRMSHEVGFYRAYLKSAALQGTAVINDPFWWEADEKFFECTLARKLGVAVPKTVVLPNKSYIERVDLSKSLRNLAHPVDWASVVAHTGLPAVLKPNTGGGWRDVYVVHSLEELWHAYDQTDTKTMILQEFIEWDDYLRCIAIGGEILPLRYDPHREFFDRYVIDNPPTGAYRDRAIAECTKLLDPLGYDMDTLEFAVRDGVWYAIDFLNPAPDFDDFSIKAEGFEWVLEKMSDLVLDYALGRRSPPWRGHQRWWKYV